MKGSGVRVDPLREEDLPAALPLFAGYQGFYEATPDDAANLRFFRRFVAPSDDGLLLGAWVGEELVGFARSEEKAHDQEHDQSLCRSRQHRER